MGFSYHHMESRLHIPAEKIADAASVLREMAVRWYPSVDQYLPDEAFIRAVAGEEGWDVAFRDGALIEASPSNKIKGGDGMDWLDAIEKFVSDGGYAQFRDDNSQVYRKVFYDGKMYYVEQIWPSKEEVLSQARKRG